MEAERWHVRGTRVPDGAPVEWWVDGARMSSSPVEGARPLPGAFVVERGLVDAHVHLSFEPHDVFGLRPGPELIAAGLTAQRRAGVLALRDAGSVDGIAPGDLAAVEGVAVAGCGPFLAPAG